ncbi:MAG TPA: hypothetical protein VGG29_09655 [Caulobacteraceae bacterium]|jgi:hypothetical protein
MTALIGGAAQGAPGTWLWMVALGVALFLWLSLTGGVFYFPGGRTIRRASAPRRYWTLIGLLGAALLGVLALGVRAFMLDVGG